MAMTDALLAKHLGRLQWPYFAQHHQTLMAEAARGRGLGRALYARLLDRMRADGVHTVVAVIALPNAASVALHETVGFRHVGTLTEVGHKFGRWIDTAWFELRLGGSSG